MLECTYIMVLIIEKVYKVRILLDLPGIGYLLVFRQTVYKLYQAYNISFLSIGARADHALIGLIAQPLK